MKTQVGLNQVKDGLSVESPQTRATSRIRIQIPVFLRGYDAKGLEFIELTRTLNISARGACIASGHMLRVGQTVHLTIPAPATASSSLVPSETPPIAAKVRRQQALGNLKVFGLEFLRSLE
jgi:PilZ domain